jgi:alkyl sulfatase BDS1-like metallo-beta-lactamase superfamily hydrolase
MKDRTIKNDAGDVVWDMTRFEFLDQKDEFDTVHPSMHRIGQLNNNYGLYEVIPGIYQVRGFDLAQTTFVRGKTGWIVFDCLVTADAMRAAWKLFQEHREGGATRDGGRLLPLPR